MRLFNVFGDGRVLVTNVVWVRIGRPSRFFRYLVGVRGDRRSRNDRIRNDRINLADAMRWCRAAFRRWKELR